MKHALLVIATVVAAAGVARAQQPSKQFLDEYQAGIDALRLGRLDEAKARLEAAKALEPSLPGPWRFLATVAKAEERWADCVASAREAIRLNPQSSEIAATRQIHDECRIAWGKPELAGAYAPDQGALSITSEPAGAAVTVGGLSYGATPILPRVVVIGEVDVVVEQAGYLPATRRVTVLPGVVTDVDVTLEADPNAKKVGVGPMKEVTTGWLVVKVSPPDAIVTIDGKQLARDPEGRYVLEQGPHEIALTAPGREPVVERVRVTRGQVTTTSVTLRDQASVDRTSRTGYTVLGAGLGVLAVGAATGWMSLQAYEQARDWAQIERTRPSFGQLPRDQSEAIHPIRTRQDIDDEIARGDTLGLVSAISYAAGAAAVGVGAYLLVKARPRGERPAVTVVPLTGDGGVGAAATAEVRW